MPKSSAIPGQVPAAKQYTKNPGMNNNILNNRRRVYLTVATIWLILLITLMSSIVAFDLQRARTHFFEKVNQLYQQVNDRVHIVESILEGFSAMVSVTNDLGRERIRSYAQKMLEQYPYISCSRLLKRFRMTKSMHLWTTTVETFTRILK